MAHAAREKVANDRARMRKAGLRLIQIWVPDTRSPRIVEEAKRQSKLVSRRKSEREAVQFIDAILREDYDL